MLVEFLAIYLAVNLSFLTLFLVIQVLTDLPQKMQAQAGLDWQSYLWQLPAIFVQISPMLTFVSSLFLLTEMMKRGELRILELGGILPLLVYDMLLLCGFLAALTVFWVNETLVPISYRHLKPARVVSGVHLSTPSFFFYGEKFIPPGYLRNVQISQLLGDGTLYTLTARQAWFEGGFWIVQDGRAWSFQPGGQLKEEVVFKQSRLKLPISPDVLGVMGQSLEGRSLRELVQLRREMTRIGLSPSSLSVAAQERVAYPFLSFFFILASIPFFYWREQLTRFFVISFSFLFSFFCYFLYSASLALARNGRLPVFLGVWMVHLLVFLVTIICVVSRGQSRSFLPVRRRS